MIRRVFVPLTGGEGDLAALAAAFAVAVRLGAHVDAALLRFDQRYSRPKLSEPCRPASSRKSPACSPITTPTRSPPSDASRRRARPQMHLLRSRRPNRAIPAGGSACGRPSASYATGGLPISSSSGRRKPPRNPRPNVIRRAALVTAGRPLLLAPALPPGTVGKQIAVAWNGSTGGAQAVAAALPLLAKADAVHVLTVKTEKTRSSEGERLVDYLQWHGITARATVLPEQDSVGDLLLANAGDLGADLLVMGGDVQNRLQELLLGGVTTYVFAHAKLPIFVAR